MFGQTLRYALATALSAVITLLFPLLLTEVFAQGARVSVAIALLTAFAVNFLSTRCFVFRSKGRVLPELLRFTLSAGAFRLCEYLAFLLLYEMLDLHYFIVLFSVLLVSVVGKFVVARRFVFSPGLSAHLSEANAGAAAAASTRCHPTAPSHSSRSKQIGS